MQRWCRAGCRPRQIVGLALALMLMFALPSRAWAGVSALDRLEHRRWIAADGGPSQVGAIVQTRDGFLWLGTNDSLVRFDGARFERVEPPGRNTLNIVSALLADGDDLWVGLRYGGVCRVRAGVIAAFGIDAGLPEGAVYALARDRSGAIWAAFDDGLARYDGARWQILDASWGLPDRKARVVFTDRGGVVWAASHERLFFLPEGGRRFIDAGLDTQWTSQIAQAPDGAIWLTERHRGRVHRVVLADGRARAASLEAGLASTGMVFDRAGGLWIGTSGKGLRYLARPTGLDALAAAERFGAGAGLSGDFVWKLYADHEGNLWTGTTAGLDRFRPRTLIPAGLPRETVNVALAPGPEGSLWAGPGNGPALRLDASGAVRTLAMPGPVTAAATDAQGTVWMGGPGGIWRSEGARLVHVAALPSAGATESAVRALARGRDGALWVSINRYGLFRLRDGRWQALAPPSALASQRMPVVASSDADGGLWFGYRDNLVVALGGAGERRWGPADGLALGHVTAIGHEDGRTWLGGQHGMGAIEAGLYRPLALPANGLFENIYAIVPVPGPAGTDLWIQSRSGIFQLEAAELRRAQREAGYRVRYRSYDLMGGLANDPYQVLPLPTAVRTGDGRLWFSASAGVAWIDPSRATPAVAGPVVSIEAVSVDGARMRPDAAGRFGPDTRRVVFEYTAPSLSAPERLNFRYRLDGYDKAWHDAGRQREAVYTGLPAGRYTFRVLAHNEEGAPSDSEARHAFDIEQVFWRRPQFVALAATLGAVGLWLLYRANLRRAARQLRQGFAERQRERERIARELHDTLLQGVTGLQLRFQVIANSLERGNPARVEIERVLDRADEVLAEGRDRVRALRTVPGEGTRLDEALAASGAGLAAGREARFVLETQGAPRPLCEGVRDQAFCIGQEALANAFAHARACTVRVVIEYAPRELRLAVRDDGRGIDAGHAGPQGRLDHWGVRGMYERAGDIGATLRVRGVPDQGSEVLLTVPAARAYARRTGGRGGWRLFGRNNKEAYREHQQFPD